MCICCCVVYHSVLCVYLLSSYFRPDLDHRPHHLSPVVSTTPVLQRSAMASTKARAEKEREKQVQDKVQAILGAMLKDEDNK